MSESHGQAVDSREASIPTDHLDRAWPGTGRGSMKQVAAWCADAPHGPGFLAGPLLAHQTEGASRYWPDRRGRRDLSSSTLALVGRYET